MKIYKVISCLSFLMILSACESQQDRQRAETEAVLKELREAADAIPDGAEYWDFSAPPPPTADEVLNGPSVEKTK